MKDVIVTVHCGTEPIKRHARFYNDNVLAASVMEAIEDAIRRGELNGFNHMHEGDFSIVVKEVAVQVKEHS